MMAESVNACHVCIHRDRTLPAVQRCDDCAMLFCFDCAFTHSYVCPTHRTVDFSARSRDGTSVDGDLATDADEEEYEPRFEIYSQFSAKLSEDDVDPLLRDAVLTDRDFILITDTGNCMMKVFDKDGNYCGGHFVGEAEENAAGRMHGIAQTEKNKFYVTMPSQKRIAALRMSEKEDGKIKFHPVYYDTKRRYFGIAHWIQEKKLLVGTTYTVDVLTYTGHYVKSISELIFQNPYNMTVENSGSVLVSDALSNAVMRVNVQGRIERLTNFGEDPFRLRGLTTNDQGNIFVCALRRTGLERLTRSGVRLGCVQPDGDNLEEAIGIDYKRTESGTWLVVALEGGMVKVFRVLHN